MAELPVRNLSGEQVDTIEVSDAVFGVPVNESLMHQAVTRILADQRAGTHRAKTRGEVSGGGAKPYRQKGTGRARQGSKRSPIFVGGGTAFPPLPRSYAVSMPKKMRRQATRAALSSRLADEAIMVVNSLQPEEPRTRAMIAALASLNAAGKILLVDEQIAAETSRAARNIPGVDMTPAGNVNILDVLNHDKIVVTVSGIRRLEERLLPDGNV